MQARDTVQRRHLDAPLHARQPSRGELAADAAVHILGILSGLAGAATLLTLIAGHGSALELAAILIYVGGLIAMLLCSAENADEFKALFAYSPLHNIKPGTRYPATLITTADHDDRVVPAHSFKFAAALQAAQRGNAPALIRIDVKAGHGAGKPTAKLIEESADKWAFLVRELNIEP